jgi:hypothetical protein
MTAQSLRLRGASGPPPGGHRVAIPPCVLCALIVPSPQLRVTSPGPQIFLPWKNRVFYDGPGVSLTDWASSGNYYMHGYL